MCVYRLLLSSSCNHAIKHTCFQSSHHLPVFQPWLNFGPLWAFSASHVVVTSSHSALQFSLCSQWVCVPAQPSHATLRRRSPCYRSQEDQSLCQERSLICNSTHSQTARPVKISLCYKNLHPASPPAKLHITINTFTYLIQTLSVSCFGVSYWVIATKCGTDD